MVYQEMHLTSAQGRMENRTDDGYTYVQWSEHQMMTGCMGKLLPELAEGERPEMGRYLWW